MLQGWIRVVGQRLEDSPRRGAKFIGDHGRVLFKASPVQVGNGLPRPTPIRICIGILPLTAGFLAWLLNDPVAKLHDLGPSEGAVLFRSIVKALQQCADVCGIKPDKSTRGGETFRGRCHDCCQRSPEPFAGWSHDIPRWRPGAQIVDDFFDPHRC
jgi:hypothetical protein